ncbi:MAG: GNAT family N-acetyltransferase [Chloroflexota bacterium]|nr:GNAT family N-acetyltransferase [Chloroflexota bacterium]
MSFRIRPYHPSDLSTLYRICMQVGTNGKDASHLYRDPDILGHLFVGPYVVQEPDLAFVLTHAEKPCGYMIGTRDSKLFHERCERDWFPVLRERYPLSDYRAEAKSADGKMVSLIHRGHRVEEGLGAYPAHLHIDLLPLAQGQGWGQKLVQTFLSRLRLLKVPAVHLGVGKQNENAIGFYEHMGFHVIEEHRKSLVMGMILQQR